MTITGGMTLLSSGLVLALLLARPLCALEEDPAAYQRDHEIESRVVEETDLNQGTKWPTDEPLRAGMRRINDAAMLAFTAYEDRTLTQDAARQLAAEIDVQVAYLVENCKIGPQADVMLHLLIGEMQAGASHLVEDPLSEQGLPGIVKALLAYPLYFDDPDWSK